MSPSILKRLALATVLALAAAPAMALYKIVGPDGSVTYTDRPPTGTAANVSTLEGGTLTAVKPLASLPIELRQTSERYPVVLYSAADCAPCDAGRQLLVQRGIPYTEKLIVSEDDAAALERAVGFRSLPALSIGKQGLRGWSSDEWGAYLDAARYPRESLLPRGWQAAVAEPLVSPRAAPASAEQPASRVTPVERVLAPAAAPASGLRF
ncbi:MAG: glutaredoxin family protein [Rubrivivax sp.]